MRICMKATRVASMSRYMPATPKRAVTRPTMARMRLGELTARAPPARMTTA
jgi:hypothetical protein